MNKTLVVLAFILGIAFADLSTLTIPATGVTSASVGNMINGAADNDNLGSNVCKIGLFNNDAYPDYGVTNAKGQVYVVLGKSSAREAAIDLGDSSATSVSNFLKISTMNTALTATCASAGKFKAAARDALVIGFPAAGTNSGEAFIIYARDTDLNANTGAGGTAFATSASTGIKLAWTTSAAGSEKIGAAVALAGDLTNDQFDDVLIGAPGIKTVFLIPGIGPTATAPVADYDFGASAGATNPALKAVGTTSDTDFGAALDGNLDFNEDNIDDFIVGSPANNKVFVFYGPSSAAYTDVALTGGAQAARYTTITLATTTGTPKFGFDVANAGDLNGDSIDDLLVSSPGYDSGSSTDIGRVYVIFGSDTNTNALAVADIADAAALTASTTQKGYVITGGIGSGALGTTLDGIGDVNEDGTGDFAISAPADSGSRASYTGKVYVIYGRTTANSAAIDLSLTTAGTGYFSSELGITLTGHQGTEFGASLAGVGDVTGDSIDDFVVGAPKSGSIGLASGVTARTANGIVYQFNGQKVTSPKSGFRLEASLLVIVSFFAALMF